MARRGHLLCPCGRAELIFDRMEDEMHEVVFANLLDQIDRNCQPRSSPRKWISCEPV